MRKRSPRGVGRGRGPARGANRRHQRGLREGALRRKAHHIAGALHAVAASQADAHAEARIAARTCAAARTSFAARLQSDRETLAETVVVRLEDALAKLRADARPVEQLADERRVLPEVRRYLIDKTVERIAPAVCEVVSSLADPVIADELTSAGVQAAVRATLAGAAAARPGRVLGGNPLRGAVEQALTAVASELERTSAAVPSSNPHRGTALRIAALMRALQ